MKTLKTMILENGTIAMTLLLAAVLGSCNEEKFDPALTRTFTIESPLTVSIWIPSIIQFNFS